MRKAPWIIFFLLFAISCLDEPDCFRLNNNIIGIAFKKMYDGKADTVAVIGVSAMNVIDTIFNKYTYTNGVYVPLDFFDEQTALTLESLYGTNHIAVAYKVRTQFVSDDCGARYVLTDLALLSDDYDSIRVVSTTPSSSEAGVHIEVYRCPRTHLMKFAFRQLQDDGSVAMTPKIDGIKPDYTNEIFVDTTLSYVNLPLNPDATQVRFDFAFQDYPAHAATVNYQSDAWSYKDKYCASKNLKLYHDLKVNSFDFDSLIIVKDSLQDPPLTNIIAYRCPETNFIRISFRTPSAPVKADSLDLEKITDDTGGVYYEGAKLAIFTLPLPTYTDPVPETAQTEFTFVLKTGVEKSLKFSYKPVVEKIFGVCGAQTTLTELDVADSLGFGLSTLKASATQFPIKTNFETIIPN